MAIQRMFVIIIAHKLLMQRIGMLTHIIYTLHTDDTALHSTKYNLSIKLWQNTSVAIAVII